MKRMFESTKSTVCFYGFVLLAGLVAFSGCDPTNSDSGKSSTVKKLPKLRFHQPKTFDQAVSRIREIVDAATSEEPLPGPKSFRVLEVIHGTGSAGHSHYYLAKDGEEPEEPQDDHGHVTTDKMIHEIEVDIRTEFVDILRWLPEIAATGEMEEADWKQAKKHANGIKDLMEANGSLEDNAKWRSCLKDKLAEIDVAIKGLESLATQ